MHGVIAQLKQLGKVRTSETYTATLNSFMVFRDEQDVPLDGISSDMMLMYEAYLKARGVRMNTISFYMRNLRAVYNRAVEKGQTPQNNPLLHVSDLPRILDCPAFNKETIREALINACIHRSLQMGSDIFIHLYPDMVEISNPGGFPYGVNLGNILTVNSSPRSRLMAEVIEKTGLIERSGQGVDIMFTNCIKEGKPLPDYSYSDDYQVDLRFYGEILDDAFYLFAQDICHQQELESRLNIFDWLTLHYIWKGNTEAAYNESCPKLLEMGLIAEDSYFGYVLSPRYLQYKPHVRTVAGQYDISHLQTVYHVIRRSGEASMSDFVAAFDGILTQKQVRNLIEGLCKTPLISSHGNARATRYIWV